MSREVWWAAGVCGFLSVSPARAAAPDDLVSAGMPSISQQGSSFSHTHAQVLSAIVRSLFYYTDTTLRVRVNLVLSLTGPQLWTPAGMRSDLATSREEEW